MDLDKPLTQQEIFESMVKEWLEPEKDKSKTIYSDKTLHFAKQIKAILLTIDHQADRQTVLDSLEVALKEIYGDSIRVSKVLRQK